MKQARRYRPLVAALGDRKDEEDEPEDEGEVDAAVDHLGQEPETRRVIVEQRQHHEERADEPRREWRERAETDLGVEFLLELAGLRLVEFHRGHDGSIARDRARAFQRDGRAGVYGFRVLRFAKPRNGNGEAARVTSATLLPCRTSRRRDGA